VIVIASEFAGSEDASRSAGRECRLRATTTKTVESFSGRQRVAAWFASYRYEDTVGVDFD